MNTNQFVRKLEREIARLEKVNDNLLKALNRTDYVLYRLHSTTMEEWDALHKQVKKTITKATEGR